MRKEVSRLVRATVVASVLAFGVSQIVLPAAALAEDNNPNPPPPKPKEPAPTPDPCANSKVKSACRNAEAVRALLREAPPMDPKPGAAATGGSGSVAAKP